MDMKVYEMFKELMVADARGCCMNSCDIAIYEKIWWATVCKVFPTEKFDIPCYMRDDFRIYEDESSKCCLDECDFVEHEMFVYSEVYKFVSAYYMSSPYWNIDCREAYLDESEYKELTDKQREDCVYITQQEYGDFFESKCMEFFKLEAAVSPVMLFAPDDEFHESCMVLKSYLLPYYLKLRDKIMREYPEIYMRVEEAIETISNSLQGGCQRILEEDFEASYFILYDGYGNNYYVEMSTASKGLILAGKVIDDSICELDSFYHFLPEHLKCIK